MESLAEQREIYDYDQLKDIIERDWECKIVSMVLKDYGYDERINWNTYMVLVTFENQKEIAGVEDAIPVGYTNGDLSTIF